MSADALRCQSARTQNICQCARDVDSDADSNGNGIALAVYCIGRFGSSESVDGGWSLRRRVGLDETMNYSTPVAENESRAAQLPSVRAQHRFGVCRQARALFRMKALSVGSLLMQAYFDWSADGATRLGAALAYYTLFSIAPLLIVITGIAGIFIGQTSVQTELSPWLQRFLSPEGARAAELMLKQHVTVTGGFITTVIGLVTLFLATSTLVNEL